MNPDLAAPLFCTCESGVARYQSLLANGFDVVSPLHGHVNLAAVNHIYVFMRF